MNFFCPSCRAYYTQPDEQIPSTGLTVKCLDCGTLIALAPAGEPGAPPLGEPGALAEGGNGRSLGRSPQAAVFQDAGGELDNLLTVPAVGPANSLSSPGAPAAPARPATTWSPPRLQPAASQAAGSSPAGPAPSVPAPAAAVSTPPPDRWRVVDLWLALRGVGYARRTVQVAAGLTLVLGLLLASRRFGDGGGTAALGVLATALALVLAWLGLLLLGGGVTAALHQEWSTGRRASLGDGVRWTLAHLQSVTLTPLLFVGVGLAGVLGVALLQLPGLVPGAGRVLLGLAYGPTLLVALATVVTAGLGLLVGFYYLPLLLQQDRGPLATARTALALLGAHGGRAVGLLVLTSVGGATLSVLLAGCGIAAVALTAAVGAPLLGGSQAALPPALPFGVEAIGLEPWLPGAAGASTDLGGLLGAAGLLLATSLLLAVVLVYLCGASLVCLHVLSGHAREHR